MKICSIQVGIGDECIYYSIDKKKNSGIYLVDEIKEEIKNIGKGLITVYRCYRKEKMFVEIEADNHIILHFEP